MPMRPADARFLGVDNLRLAGFWSYIAIADVHANQRHEVGRVISRPRPLDTELVGYG